MNLPDEPAPLRATRAVLKDLGGDDALAALGTLGPAVHRLDQTAYDAGFRLLIEISRDDRNEAASGDQ
jgi:hypothetical protein